MKAHLLKNLVFILILGLSASGLAYAQAGRGVGRIGGVVVDTEDKPIEGAKVMIVYSQDENLKYETATNKKGEWAFLGLGTGNWNMTASVKGFLPVSKPLYVSQLSVNPKVTVRLQKTSKGGGGIIQDETTFAFLEKANQLFKDKKYDEAIASYQQFMEKNPAAYQISLSIADCYQEKGEIEKAMELYHKIIEQAKTDQAMGKEMTAKAQAGIGNCYLKQNKLQEAQDFFKQSVDNSPNDEILAYNVGEIYFKNQKFDDALRYFDLAAQIKPDWPDPYLKLGYVFLNKADNASAISKLEKFLSLEPEGERAALAKNIINAIKK
jgi:tetratricopeptide (TPR) repeat protein